MRRDIERRPSVCACKSVKASLLANKNSPPFIDGKNRFSVCWKQHLKDGVKSKLQKNTRKKRQHEREGQIRHSNNNNNKIESKFAINSASLLSTHRHSFFVANLSRTHHLCWNRTRIVVVLEEERRMR